jgi:hypothetical protein
MSKNIDRTYGLIDRATGDEAPHVTVKYTLISHFEGEPKQAWTFNARMPRAISDQLGKREWEEVLIPLTTKTLHGLSPFESLLLYLRAEGSDSARLQERINHMVSRALYQKFVLKQIAAGNSMWLAPRSMTDTRGEPL